MPWGAITGHPTQPGTYSFTVQVTDQSSPTPTTASATLTIDDY